MKPPQHRADAPMQYIHRDDPAWDMDRLEPEVDRLEGEALEHHPLVQYFAGRTRFDLDAVGEVGESDEESVTASPRDYLVGEPRVWQLRPLKVREVSWCLDQPTRQGQEMAFRLGVKGLDNPPEGMLFKPPKTGAMKDSHVEEVARYIGMDVIYDVGRAVLVASRQPTEQEKKP